MIVLVVSTGLAVIGCDAVFVQSVSVAGGAGRVSADGQWVRDAQSVIVIPMKRCDEPDVLLLAYASDPENPCRATMRLTGMVYRPGDINRDGVENAQDVAAFLAGAYDYNLDGAVTSADYMEILNNIYGTHLCE